MKKGTKIGVCILGVFVFSLAFLAPSTSFHAKWVLIAKGTTARDVLSFLGEPDSTGTTFFPQPNGQLKRPGHISYSWRGKLISYQVLFDSETNTPNTMRVHDKWWHPILFEK